MLPLAPASAEPPSKAWQQLEAVERRQRRPAPLAEQLRALEPRLAVDSAERLEAQTCSACWRRRTGTWPRSPPIVKWLQDWPLDELQPSAQVAAACVWASTGAAGATCVRPQGARQGLGGAA